MSKSSTQRHMDWRRRLIFKASMFDQQNAERVERIKRAFAGEEIPEVLALASFFVNYPRCENPPHALEVDQGVLVVQLTGNNPFEAAAVYVAVAEVSSLPVEVLGAPASGLPLSQVRDEVAEMRALGLWGKHD